MRDSVRMAGEDDPMMGELFAGRQLPPYARSFVLGILLLVCLPALANADALDDARALYRKGEYQACLDATNKAIEDGQWRDAWRVLKIECELTLGRYDEAKKSVEAALKRYSTDLSLRWVAFKTFRFHGDMESASQKLDELESLANDRPWRYTDTESRLTLGRYFLDRQADPRQILELFYDKAKKSDPKSPDPYIASGELALEKHDYGLAADEFRKAVKLDETRADAHFGLALSVADNDADAAAAAAEKALELNPNLLSAWIHLAERHIDGERYGEAKKAIAKVHKVNPHHAEAWALRAVIAHLDAKPDDEKKHRGRALKWWPNNPNVDHLIGRKLSQKYRFREGAAAQRSALKMKADFLPAKLQLCQDLLRLGDEEEGWKLADEVNQLDGYSVVAHNLVSLHDEIDKFTTLHADGFEVRMSSKEAAIYGRQVLQLLTDAREHLVEKYQVELQEPIIVEIFPRQADFAIRTFGLPGGAGFLGVCFGRVITANSPATQTASPTNWQSVLWHEYCHVVTLQKTDNKMPRWLSEGISVYEERKRDPRWGQVMNAEYREMVLGDDLTPVSELSGAFLRPPSPTHLQFAYYESSLVVEYLVETHGFETLLRVLDDLKVGMPINESLARYTGGVKSLDEGFAKYAREKAEKLAPKLDFTKPEKPLRGLDALDDFLAEHPNNYFAMTAKAQAMIQAEQWDEAESLMATLQEHYADDRSPLSAGRMQTLVHRRKKDRKAEKSALEAWCKLSGDDLEAFLRAIELAAEDKRWDEARRYAGLAIAVNPLRADIHRHLAAAAEQVDDRAAAITSLESLLEIGAVDPAGVYFRLAKLLKREGQLEDSKRRTLQALEEAPRYLDAHRLLRQLKADDIAEDTAEKNAKSSDANPSDDKPGDDKPSDDKSIDDKPGEATAEDAKPGEEKPAGEETTPQGDGKKPAANGAQGEDQ